MASEPLSQNEIDALLGGVRASGAPVPVATAATATAGTKAGTQLYDFRRPHRISIDKLRSLEAMYERFSKSLEGWLLSRVRGHVQLTLQSVEQFSFGEFALSLPTPCSSYTFEILNSGGQQGVLDFGNEFAYFLVDRLFGGGVTSPTPGRALTPLERMAIRTVAERVLTIVSEVWQDYIEMDLELTGFESIPEILRVANREDPMLVANVEVIAGDTRSLLLICLPFAVLEKFFAGVSERRTTHLGSPEEQATNRIITEASLRGTRVAIAARLPQFRIALRELVSLATGSVIATGISRGADIDLLVGSQPRFRARPGRVGPSLAVRINEGVLPAPEQITIPFTRS
ncbi:MAG: Flagellar motor switch protein FliM [Gemmatimonadaceae bacterium]|nr:Flagellar motor switch protein FliM [Gemmatimonadaceae bacterium]